MNPYFAERVAAERRKDLMREADRWRLAHAQGPKAHRRATWWPLRARGRSPGVVMADAQAVAPAGARPRLVGAGAEQVIENAPGS